MCSWEQVLCHKSPVNWVPRSVMMATGDGAAVPENPPLNKLLDDSSGVDVLEFRGLHLASVGVQDGQQVQEPLGGG